MNRREGRRDAAMKLPMGNVMAAGCAGETRVLLPTVAASIAFLPFITPTGPANTSPVDVFITAALAGGAAWAVSQRPRLRLPYVGAMALYVGGGAIGSLIGPVPVAGLLALVQDVVLVAWALVIANAVRDAQGLRLMLRTWVAAGVAWAALMIVGVLLDFGFLAGTNPEFGGRAALRFSDPNMAGTYFVTTIMLVWATAMPSRRVHRFGAYAVLLWALALTGSNGSFAALTIAIGVATIVRIALQRRLIAAIGLGCAGAAVAAALILTVDLASIQESAEDAGRTGELTLGRSDASIDGRVELKRLGWELYGTGTVFGTGPESAAWRLSHAQAPLDTELHDDYLATLVERGIVGATGLALLIGSAAMRCRALMRPPLPPPLAAVLPRPWAIAGAISGLAVAALFYQVLHFRHLWALLALVAAVGFVRDGGHER